MNSNLVEVISGVRSLAEQKGWKRAAAAAGELMSEGRSAKTLVAAAEGVEAGDFRRWVAATTGNEPSETPLAALEADGWPAVAADKVVALFECGRLLEAEDVEAVNSSFFTRPSSSYAVILSRAERLESEEELNLTLRNAWRLLVPDPKPDWSGQDLLEQRCFLWSDGVPGDFVAGRVARDREALSAWLGSVPDHVEEIERLRTLHVLEFADEEARRAREDSEPGGSDADVRARLLSDTRDTLSEIRRRLLRRLDADSSSSARQITASLQTLESTLLSGLRRRLRQHASYISSSTERELRRILVEYIEEVSAPWRRQTDVTLSERAREILSDTEELLQSVDWGLVNEVAAEKGKAGGYPSVLLQDIAFGSDVSSLDVDSVRVGAPARASSGDPLSTAIKLAVGGALATASAATFGLLVTGGAVAAVGTYMFSRHRREMMRDAEMYGIGFIKEAITDGISNVHEQIQRALSPLRERISGGLREVEEMLDLALHETYIAAHHSQQPADDSDSRILDEYRRRVAAVGAGVN